MGERGRLGKDDEFRALVRCDRLPPADDDEDTAELWLRPPPPPPPPPLSLPLPW